MKGMILIHQWYFPHTESKKSHKSLKTFIKTKLLKKSLVLSPLVSTNNLYKMFSILLNPIKTISSVAEKVGSINDYYKNKQI